MNFKQAQPPWMENVVVPIHRISTEEMADDLTCDLSVIADRIREYESDIAALKRLRDTKASQLECCIRALGRQP